jgi:hypothetical protein
MSYLILGSGGLGSALARALARRGEEWLLAGRQLPRGLDPACYFPLQEVDSLSFEALFTLYDSTTLPTVVINTIGLLHDLAHMPERRVEEVTPMARRVCWPMPGPTWPLVPTSAAHDAPEHALALHPLRIGREAWRRGPGGHVPLQLPHEQGRPQHGLPDPGG